MNFNLNTLKNSPKLSETSEWSIMVLVSSSTEGDPLQMSLLRVLKKSQIDDGGGHNFMKIVKKCDDFQRMMMMIEMVLTLSGALMTSMPPEVVVDDAAAEFCDGDQ